MDVIWDNFFLPPMWLTHMPRPMHCIHSYHFMWYVSDSTVISSGCHLCLMLCSSCGITRGYYVWVVSVYRKICKLCVKYGCEVVSKNYGFVCYVALLMRKILIVGSTEWDVFICWMCVYRLLSDCIVWSFVDWDNCWWFFDVYTRSESVDFGYTPLFDNHIFTM